MEEGKKETENKIDWSFVPMQQLDRVARVFEKGSVKYKGKMTWLPGIRYSKLYSAIIRHLVAWFFDKEDFDAESGEPHLSHVIANCLMLLTFISQDEFDDRGREKNEAKTSENK